MAQCCRLTLEGCGFYSKTGCLLCGVWLTSSSIYTKAFNFAISNVSSFLLSLLVSERYRLSHQEKTTNKQSMFTIHEFNYSTDTRPTAQEEILSRATTFMLRFKDCCLQPKYAVFNIVYQKFSSCSGRLKVPLFKMISNSIQKYAVNHKIIILNWSH